MRSTKLPSFPALALDPLPKHLLMETGHGHQTFSPARRIFADRTGGAASHPGRRTGDAGRRSHTAYRARAHRADPRRGRRNRGRPAAAARGCRVRLRRRYRKPACSACRMPSAWGGAELDPLTQFRVIEALAMVDGSAGWCAMINCDGGYVTAFLDQDIARAMYPGLQAHTR